MNYHQIFKASLYEFKKLAAFRLLPIGKVFTYVFIFVFFFTVISFSRFIIGDDVLFDASPDLQEHSEKIGALIFPIAFILQLVISTFYIFIRVSAFAYIGSLMIKLMKRRGQYLHVWRTSAIAMTLPILITIVFDFFPELKSSGLIISSIIHFTYIVLAIKYYPKQPELQRNH
ncbi:DUF1189 family protein [Sporosarcina pasteurii]|uniref:Protein of uncharacterized function (DUF1189) n=1 Tax=Sporosarcina pasteurii TaxID=1474 RepID=A0A380BQ79_SPOPA|nr:DUF1189 family protein [Sporosarcina pasteurii]MDS9471057.1 DUF1189 family protein [Sporosarcina pasteurii]SUJ04182.1 Protein of uncharacterised function (DUF1189) [Sporosarcina pasteurii]